MEFDIYDLGLVGYRQAWDFQKDIFSAVKSGSKQAALIFCRHYPVLTLGRKSGKASFRFEEAEIKKRGVELFCVERGGDITYHGPGQQVIYPVLSLGYFHHDLHAYLDFLESIVIDLLNCVGIPAESLPGLRGAWVGGKKISSIGIAVKNWIAYHGLSINVKANDLANFGLIRPCGMEIEMIAMEQVLNREISFEEIKEFLIGRFTYDKSNFAGIR